MAGEKRRGSRPGFWVVTLLCVGFLLVLSYYQAILRAAGKYLAPEGTGKADVVIVESSEVIRERAIKEGIGFLWSGKAARLIVVYQDSGAEKIFGRPPNFGHFLARKLEDHGLKKNQIKVISVPKEHPVTLTEARIVLSSLSQDGTRSAILLAGDFHTRRSYWAYKEVGSRLGIEIIPCPNFGAYHYENWWYEIQGIRDFVMESVKFFYYVLRGYIPVKSLVVT